MKPFKIHRGLVTTLDRVNVDTDQMVPKQFLKRIQRTGFGDVLFFDWRYLSDGKPNPEFEMNDPRYHGASILLTRENFGCGSSREHAVWAVQDYGLQVVVAPSFADIFYQNCFNNGVLPVTLTSNEISSLFAKAATGRPLYLTVDLEQATVTADDGWQTRFEVAPYHRSMLLSGLDNIGASLQKQNLIDKHERSIPSFLAHRNL